MNPTIMDNVVLFTGCVLEHHTTRVILKYLFWTHFTLFIMLLFLATVGKKFGIRLWYVTILNKLFNFVASKEELEEEEEEEEEREKTEEESEDAKEYGVVISPEAPVFKKDPSKTGHFHFEDSLPYISVGMQAIVEDIVGKTFTPAELSTWNMLSRTKRKLKKRIKKSRSVTSLWLLGVFIRYVFFVPVRLVILAISLTTMVSFTFLVGRLPDGEFKKTMNAFVVCWCFDFVASALSVVGRFHDRQNRPTHGIAVANHTSPIDSMVLATDNCYDMVGQKTGGFLGIFMNALSKSSTHIWFERTCSNQRNNALNKMLDHSQNSSLPPILIFPEGACVNNTSVLLFRKGVFGFDVDIYPIAVKFDSRYGDAFWYKHGFFAYCLSIMTSWAIVCDIWYLPPMRKQPDESPLQFAGRVKSAIAQKGGLIELDWDGFIKVLNEQGRHSDKKVEKEKNWLKKQQMEFAKHLKQIENEPSI